MTTCQPSFEIRPATSSSSSFGVKSTRRLTKLKRTARTPALCSSCNSRSVTPRLTVATPRAMPFACSSASISARLSAPWQVACTITLRAKPRWSRKAKSCCLDASHGVYLRSGAKGNSAPGPNTWQCASTPPAGTLKRGLEGLAYQSSHPGVFWNCIGAFPLLRLRSRQDAIGFHAPVRTARELVRSALTEHAFVGKVGDPRLSFGRALRRPRREAGLAYGFGDFAYFFTAAPAMFDRALEEVSGLLFPVDARKRFLQRQEHCILDAVGACRGEAFDDHCLQTLDHHATAHLGCRGDAEFFARYPGGKTERGKQRLQRCGALATQEQWHLD